MQLIRLTLMSLKNRASKKGTFTDGEHQSDIALVWELLDVI